MLDTTEFSPCGDLGVSARLSLPCPTDNGSAPIHLGRRLLAFAALFHDLGKLTEGMQRVLNESAHGIDTKSQPVRHELVSFLLLHLMYEVNPGDDEMAFLDRLAQGESSVMSLLSSAWKRLPIAMSGVAGHKFPQQLGTANAPRLHKCFPVDDAPLMHAMGFCVLSHHHMPQGRDASTLLHEPLVDLYVKNTGDHLPVKEFCRPCTGWKQAVSQGWCNGVASAAVYILSHVRRHGMPDTSTILVMSAHLLRNCLIFADHEASRASKPSGHAAGKGKHLHKDWTAHAKTMKAGSARVLGDTWWMHTARVSLRAKVVFATLMNLDRVMPHIEQTDYPKRSGAGRFSWQDDACDRLADLTPASGAALVFMVSGTGTGKTSGGLRLSMTGTKQSRVTCALGLRSLTLQTGAEYSLRMRVPAHLVTTIVGNPLDEAIQEAYRVERDASPGDQPREHTDESMADNELTPGCNKELPKVIREFSDSRRKVAVFVTKPIVACTVDMLARATDARQGNHMSALLRLASSNLILDEFESYGLEDAHALCRLIYLSAMAGRRVVVSSATLSPVLAAAVHLSYQAGMRARGKMAGQPMPFAVLFASEFACEGLLQDGSGDEDAAQAAFTNGHMSFTAVQAAALSVLPAQRKARILNLSGMGWMDAALTEACFLHSHNHVMDPLTGRKFSMGFIRLNTTRHVRLLASHTMRHGLPNLPDGSPVEVRALCYHAKFPVAVRAATDAVLGSMLSRGHEKSMPDPILNAPHVRAALDDGGNSDLVFLVVSTPLLELGRDFDFDWGIIEPSSISAAIQAAGRVGRHRPWLHHTTSNLSVMDRTLEAWSMEYQGMFAKAHVRHSGMTDLFEPAERDVRALFPFDRWAERMDATDAILPRSMGACIVEARRSLMLHGHLPPGSLRLFKVADKMKAVSFIEAMKELSIGSWLGKPCSQLTNAQSSYRQFRRKGERDAVFAFVEGTWKLCDERNYGCLVQGTFENKVSVLPNSYVNMTRSLLPARHFDIAHQVASAKSMLGRNADVQAWSDADLTLISVIARGGVASLRVDWHPVLGMDRI